MRSSALAIAVLLVSASLPAQETASPRSERILTLPTAAALVQAQPLASRTTASAVDGMIELQTVVEMVQRVAPGTQVTIPVAVDPTGIVGADVASLSVNVSWDPAVLVFDSVHTAGFGTLTSNTASAATGSLSLSVFSVDGSTAPQTMANLHFTATGTVGGTVMLLEPTAMGNGAGASVLAQVFTSQSSICTAAPGLWGDVNDDAAANIIDAQQLARASVNLSVANAMLVAMQGDVTADGNVNILDAQQVARSTVGLTSAPRIGVTAFEAPAITSIDVSHPTVALQSGATMMLAATPRTAGGDGFAGCVPVTWSSNATSVATVDTDGQLIAVGDGEATITAAVGGVTATSVVTVGGEVAPTTGVQLDITSPIGASRFFVYITGESLAEPQILNIVNSDPRSHSIAIALPGAATEYTLYVFAADSLSASPDAAPLMRAGGFYDVLVTDGSLSPVAANLGAITLTGEVPTTGVTGSAVEATITLVDPSEFFTGATWVNAYVASAAPTMDRSVPASQITNLTPLSSSSLEFNGSIFAPVDAGTLHTQFGMGLGVAPGLIFWVISPSVQRAEALHTTTITASPTAAAVRVAIESPVEANRYLVAVDTGAGGSPVLVSTTGAPATLDTIVVPVSAGGTYRVRVAALNEFSNTNGRILADLLTGTMVTGVVVADNDTTDVATVLEWQWSDIAIPDTSLVGMPVAFEGIMVDPSRLLVADGCAVRTSTTPMGPANIGVLSSNCSSTGHLPTGERTIVGELPGLQAPGTLYSWVLSWQSFALPTNEVIEIDQTLYDQQTVIVDPPTTGVRVNIASPVAASRYFVYVRDGALGTPALRESMHEIPATADVIELGLPAGSGYTVTVLAANAAWGGDTHHLLAAGTRVELVNVTEGQFTDVEATLDVVSALTTVPALVTEGQPVEAVVTLEDPSRLIADIATWANAYLNWGAFTHDRDGTSLQLDSVTVLSPTSKQFTGSIAAARDGTLTTQFGFGVSLLGGEATFWILDVSMERAEALHTTTVTPITSGIRVNVTSPVPASRFIVAVDTGYGGTPIIADLTGSAMTSGMVEVPVPVGTSYRVRAAAVDWEFMVSATRISASLLAGASTSGVVVAADAFTDVPITLVAETQAMTVPTTGTIGVDVPISGTMTDPSLLSDSFQCAVRWSDVGPIGPDELGTLNNTCWFENEQADGTRSAMGTIAARPDAGIRHWSVISWVVYLLPEGLSIELTQINAGTTEFTP